MNNVIEIQGFQFTDYRVGLRRILKTLEKAKVTEAERGPFLLQQVGEFFRLARNRTGLSASDAGKLFGLTGDEILAVERGEFEIPAHLVLRFCARYGVEKDFEEFYTYLRGAVRPEELEAFLKIRPILERMGLIQRREDW